MESTKPRTKAIFVISGPAGCGKTSVASFLSQELAAPFLEGDDYHSAINKSKMSRGCPLTDFDRWGWLSTLRKEATKQLHTSETVFVTCSALKRSYRDVLRQASSRCDTAQVYFVFLGVDEQLLKARLQARVGHYMKENMLRSQLEILEEPTSDESDVIRLDIKQDKEAVCRNVLSKVKARLRLLEALQND